MSERLLIDLIRKVVRLFYSKQIMQLVIDYLCENKKIEENKFALDYHLSANQVTGCMNMLEQHGFVTKREMRKDRVDARVKSKFPSGTKFYLWTFNTNLMNVIRYRLIELEQKVNMKITESENTTYTCKACNLKNFTELQVHMSWNAKLSAFDCPKKCGAQVTKNYIKTYNKQLVQE